MNDLAIIIAAILSGPVAVWVKSRIEDRKQKKMLSRLERGKESSEAREDFKVVEASQRRLIGALYKEMDRKEKECFKEIKAAVEHEAQKWRDELEKVKRQFLEKIVELESQLPVPEVPNG